MSDPNLIEGPADLTSAKAQLLCDWTDYSDGDGLMDRLVAAFPDLSLIHI